MAIGSVADDEIKGRDIPIKGILIISDTAEIIGGGILDLLTGEHVGDVVIRAVVVPRVNVFYICALRDINRGIGNILVGRGDSTCACRVDGRRAVEVSITQRNAAGCNSPFLELLAGGSGYLGKRSGDMLTR